MKTRTFIWGLILLFLGATGAAIGVIRISGSGLHGFWQWASAICSLISVVMGLDRINKTTL